MSEEVRNNYKEMLRLIFRQLDKECYDDKVLKEILKIFNSKYMAEAFVRPMFGDDDEIYEMYYNLIYGIAELNGVDLE